VVKSGFPLLTKTKFDCPHDSHSPCSKNAFLYIQIQPGTLKPKFRANQKEKLMKLAKAIGQATLVAALALTGSAVHAQETKTLDSGVTKVALSSGFVSALEGLGLRAGTVGPTHLRNGIVNFPVTGGAVDLDTAKAQILHSGGLTLTPASAPENTTPTVALESFIIDTTGSAPVITGLVIVKGALIGRVPLFNLQLPAGITLPLQIQDGQLVLDGVGVTLTSTAAQALNSVFNVTALEGGFNIGTAKVRAFVGDGDGHEGWR
jgi:hypothetical protein